jgi:hypothetical protein
MGMSRSQSLGNMPGPISGGRPIHPPSPKTVARYLSDKPLPQPTPSPQSRNFAETSVESSTPPLSAVGNFRHRPNATRPVITPRLSVPAPASDPMRHVSMEGSTSRPVQRRQDSVSSQKRQSSQLSEKDGRRMTFGRSMVSPISTSSPRLSGTFAVSPRLSMQHPPTPPPDIPLPPVPTGESAVSPKATRRFSQLPMPSRLHPSVNPASRPGLQSRHSAASRLPTRALRHQKSSPELESATWSRTATRPRTPWAIAPGPSSPELIQFAQMESLNPMLSDEPLSPVIGMTLSPSFDAIGAILEEPTTRSSLIVDTEPPWIEGTDSLHQGSPMLDEPTQQSAIPHRPAFTSSSTWTASYTQFATSAPPMKKAVSSGLEGIKQLLAQVDDWTRVHARGNLALEDPFNARAETTMHREMTPESEGYVVWGTAL